MIEAATRRKLDKLPNPDPWLVEMAMALARLMDSEPTSAVAKELRAVVDLLCADKTPEDDLKTRLSAATVGHAKD